MTAPGAGAIDPWFPDILAAWYDTFAPQRDHPDVEQWRYVRTRGVETWTADLVADPHAAAARIDEAILDADAVDQLERTFQALQASSDAIVWAGISPIKNYGGPGWTAIRDHWRRHGNLARAAPGFVLPRHSRRFPWQGTRPRPKLYHDASMIGPGFIRVVAPPEVDVTISTVPDFRVPLESLDDRLKIAVAPLVHAMTELRFTRIDDAGGRRAFRVTLEDPAGIASRAERAIDEAGRRGCDILLLPELCLTPDGQQQLSRAAAAAAVRWTGRPWLIVAGSAHTPADGGYHNRAVVIDSAGIARLTHNKLFPYEMSGREQSRYGIGEALRSEPRVEDIVVVPRRLHMLECALGRTAVLICEDLSNVVDVLGEIVRDFDVDWLLVPVMDGVQTGERWTAHYARHVSQEFGTNVLVGTCGALVTAHRADLRAAGQADPGHLCGVVVQRAGWDARARTMPSTEGDDLVVFELTG